MVGEVVVSLCSERHLKVAVWIGLVASLGGFVYLLWIIFEYALRGTDVPGFPTLACLILLFGGLQLTVLGVIGEYLSRSYIEGKHRPLYIAKEHLTNEGRGEGER